MADALRTLTVRAQNEGTGTGLQRGAGRARRPGRRRGPAAAGAAQPGRQRDQVHQAGRGGRAGGSRRRPRARRGGRPSLHGDRHRHRHPARRAGADLPGLRAGGQLHHAEIRRHRPGPDHRRAAGRPDGRGDRRGERAGPGQHLHLHGAVRAAATPPGAGRRSAVGLDSTRRRAGPRRGAAAHPGGRGQRVQLATPRAAAGQAGSRRAGGDRRPGGTGSGRTRAAFDLLLLDVHMPELDGFQVVAGDPGAGAGRPGDTCPSSP